MQTVEERQQKVLLGTWYPQELPKALLLYIYIYTIQYKILSLDDSHFKDTLAEIYPSFIKLKIMIFAKK